MRRRLHSVINALVVDWSAKKIVKLSKMLGCISANREHFINISLTESYGISNKIFQLPRNLDYGRRVIQIVTVVLYQKT